ncbi:MAG TPA: high-affinity branched-chain amino acid ABC transporter ATP-binding protein LivG, partial [Syntrophobacteraceae bacterium]|nr:high-affinity branched-chain amino acid ABC transporter ATP-binding protein LivG [Syntrophobacteraceae bacterium]
MPSLVGPSASETGQNILQLQDVQMNFGGVAALDGVTCDIPRNIIHAVIGPNGAGKTTLFHCISGILHPTDGTIRLEIEQVNGLPPHRIARMGISRTFQHVALFNHMTVLENVMLGRHIQSRAGFWATGLRLPGMRREERHIRERALVYLDFVGLADSAHLPAGTLPLGKQKVLEIARALATEPRLLLLDEPAGGLNMTETEELGELIQRVREMGATVLLVEHDMNLVMDISDRILVLHYGKRLAVGTPKEIKDN